MNTSYIYNKAGNALPAQQIETVDTIAANDFKNNYAERVMATSINKNRQFIPADSRGF